MPPEDLFLRRAIVVGSALVYWAGVWLQARRVRRRIGRSPNLKPRGAKERLLWAGWMLVVAAWLGQPFLAGGANSAFTWRLAPAVLHPAGLAAGFGLVLAGYAGTLWCYAAMGDAWRIGVNRKEKTALVAAGPYRFVRHPIYLFQIVMLAGVLLLLPTALSLFILALHFSCVRIKAADEETYLLAVHNETYRNYLLRTGRLIPKLGRTSSRIATCQSRTP
jgi:protein-S-isoprenylcysteine O-methyltransferase Ste14